jgi:hypothetical protein
LAPLPAVRPEFRDDRPNVTRRLLPGGREHGDGLAAFRDGDRFTFLDLAEQARQM